jgi:hypothetical protein
MNIEITVLCKADGLPLTKRIALGPAGSLMSDGSACVMSRGTAWRFDFSRIKELSELIDQFGSDQALTLGGLRPDLPARVEVVTKRKLNGAASPNVIARTRDYFTYRSGQPALALVDYDTRGMPHNVANKITELGGLWPTLVSVIPELNGVTRLERKSTSAGLFRSDTGEMLPGSGGAHVFLAVQDGEDIKRFLKALHARCWLAGLGWLMVGAGGQLLERSIVDRVVGSPEHLVFEGAPVLVPPLAQDKASRRPVSIEGEVLDTLAACPPLTILERARLHELRAKEAAHLEPEADNARKTFITNQAARLAERTGMAPNPAARIIERQCVGVLLPDVVLPFDDEDLAGAAVADVLADPARFEDATLADPIEGITYGAGKAKIMRRADGTMWINSFAHGRTVYELKYDYRSVAAALNKASAEEVAEVFVRYVLSGDLGEDEIERLRILASQIGGIGKRFLAALLKQARKEQTARRRQEERQQHLADRRDPRPQIPAPAPDAPWLPQMAVLNDMLGAATEPEPPMRDIDGVIARVRVRRTPNMHAFTAFGANEEETEELRLPPPEQSLLTRLSEAQLAELIEHYIDYIDNTGRSVHLNGAFVRHFHARDDDKLPLAVAIATAPIVLDNGTLLAGRGLHRDRGIIFRVPPELSAILTKKEDCTSSRVAAAMQFLTDEWLCDVACDYGGKCTLIAAALTIIERSLLPDRPTFWVTAGRRGGGKTTTIIMLLTAVTGIRPAAAAWSPNEEERRKALLAYLLEALPAIVWDNIPRGAKISCPHIEKSCTSAMYSDRKLGVSETIATSAATIHFFTGNNIGPRGDLASRSLIVRLAVDRPDPENRTFRHPDPIAWTEVHRGRILQALYIILLGNPLFRSPSAGPPQTRFKIWWSLIGHPVEYAARQHKEHVTALVIDAHPTFPPTCISFKNLFLVQEEDDEDSASLADALAVLAEKWPNETLFQAADVAKLANATGEWANEREHAITLREFLFPGIPPHQAVTAKATGKRLKRHVDEPVPRDGNILSLKQTPDTHVKISNFYVASRPNAG